MDTNTLAPDVAAATLTAPVVKRGGSLRMA